MTNIAIPDDVFTTLSSVASSRGCKEEDLASVFIQEGLHREHCLPQADDEPAPAYTASEIAHLQQGMAEADRGEFVPDEELQAFFDDWRRNG